ncbi:MAG TPA: hypothetical protein VFM21_12125 [Terriglobia bacterium]|nr:hypothetical protein [Terriglobia bacterium]
MRSKLLLPAGTLRTILACAILVLASTRAFPADLQEDTAKAYDRYIQASEARMARDRERPGTFLHIETLPAAAQQQIWAALKRGEVWVYPLVTEEPGGKEIRAPHGTITHWAGDAFFPGANIDQVLSIILDFDHLSNIYKPEIVQSRLVDRQGGIYRAFVRMHKDTPWVNPTFNVDWQGSTQRLNPKHASCRMVSTRIAQVENAGQSDEHEDSVGRDGGYLWRLNTYWRLEERDGGVVGEWEAITLSRDIPFLLRWLVRPFVDRLARQTIRDTLVATRNEAAKRRKSARLERSPAQDVSPACRPEPPAGLRKRLARSLAFAPP